jgi:hypothetical protein
MLSLVVDIARLTTEAETVNHCFFGNTTSYKVVGRNRSGLEIRFSNVSVNQLLCRGCKVDLISTA